MAAPHVGGGEPQLHIHVVVVNVAEGTDGTWSATGTPDRGGFPLEAALSLDVLA